MLQDHPKTAPSGHGASPVHRPPNPALHGHQTNQKERPRSDHRKTSRRRGPMRPPRCICGNFTRCQRVQFGPVWLIPSGRLTHLARMNLFVAEAANKSLIHDTFVAEASGSAGGSMMAPKWIKRAPAGPNEQQDGSRDAARTPKQREVTTELATEPPKSGTGKLRT